MIDFAVGSFSALQIGDRTYQVTTADHTPSPPVFRLSLPTTISIKMAADNSRYVDHAFARLHERLLLRAWRKERRKVRGKPRAA